jgi:hypothetical protein
MGERRRHRVFWLVYVKERDHFGDLSVEENMILKR